MYRIMWKQLFRYSLMKQMPKMIRKPPIRTLMLYSTSQVINIENSENLNGPSDIDALNFTSDMETVSLKNDEAFHNLIKTLNACVLEICEQYQHCVAKQIEITLVCMNLEPVGEHWDDLTKYRVEASDLKVEFEKYCLLIERMGEVIKTQNNESIDMLKENYETLLQLLEEKQKENSSWDHKLLDINTKSILFATH